MSWYIALTVALLLVATALVLAVQTIRGRKGNRLHALIAICFAMALVLCAPAYLATYAGETLRILKTVVLCFHKAIRVFGADEMYDVVLEWIHVAPPAIRTVYVSLTMAVQFLAPLLTFSFLLSFFKNASAMLRYWLSYFRTVYVFSELNEKSLALATDLHRQHPRARVVFTDVYESEDDEVAERIDRAKQQGAICFKKDLRSVRFSFHSRASALYFFAIGDDELQNVEQALQIIEKMNMRDNTHLYLVASGMEGELLLAGREKGKLKVRRVNEARSLVYRVLYEQGTCLFERATPIGENEKQISAVVVGLGRYGSEMLKALAWYCQMDGYRVRVHAFEKDALAEQRLQAQCEELLSPQYNGVTVPGEGAYDIHIHAGCDVNTKAFADGLAAIGDVTYVFVSLGSDEANIRAAVQLRRLCERNGAKPVIHAVIGSSEAGEALSHVKNHAGQPYGITFVGDVESSYSERVIINSDAEEDAWNRHKAYCNGDPDAEEDFWRHEYCYRSSMALALHAAARVACGIPGADKPEDALTDEEKQTLQQLEHRRWNVYMRAEGYVYSGSPERSSRNDLGKMHNNLVVFDALTDEDKAKDSRVGAAVKE